MRRVLLLGALLGTACIPKPPQAPDAAKPPTRITLPPLYKPVALTELARPLPPAPEPCQVGTRQEGPVITEIVACGDRGVTRVMVLPSEAPPAGELLGMAMGALHIEGRTLTAQTIGFPAYGRTLTAQRLLEAESSTFVGLAVVHPEGPWPELLTCSGLAPSAALETWCAQAVSALLLPDDPSKLRP